MRSGVLLLDVALLFSDEPVLETGSPGLGIDVCDGLFDRSAGVAVEEFDVEVVRR